MKIFFKRTQKVFLSLMLTLCIVVPAVLLAGCGGNSRASRFRINEGTYRASAIHATLGNNTFDLVNDNLAQPMANELRDIVLGLLNEDNLDGLFGLLQSLTGSLGDIDLLSLLNMDLDQIIEDELLSLLSQANNLHLTEQMRNQIANLIIRYTRTLGDDISRLVRNLLGTELSLDGFMRAALVENITTDFLMQMLVSGDVPPSFHASLRDIFLEFGFIRTNQSLLDVVRDVIPQGITGLGSAIDLTGLVNLYNIVNSVLPEGVDIEDVAFDWTSDEQFALIFDLIFGMMDLDEPNVIEARLDPGFDLYISLDVNGLILSLPGLMTDVHFQGFHGSALFDEVVKHLLYVIVSDVSFYHLFRNIEFFRFMQSHMPSMGGFLDGILAVTEWLNITNIAQGLFNTFDQNIREKVYTAIALDLWQQESGWVNWSADINAYLAGQRTRPGSGIGYGFWHLDINWGNMTRFGPYDIRSYHYISTDIAMWRNRIGNTSQWYTNFANRGSISNHMQLFTRVGENMRANGRFRNDHTMGENVDTALLWGRNAWHFVDRGYLTVRQIGGLVSVSVGPVMEVIHMALDDLVPTLMAAQGLNIQMEDLINLIVIFSDMYSVFSHQIHDIYIHLIRQRDGVSNNTDGEVIVRLLASIEPFLIDLLQDEMIMGLARDLLPGLVAGLVPPPFDSDYLVEYAFDFVFDNVEEFIGILLGSDDIITDLWFFFEDAILDILDDDYLMQVLVNIANYFIPPQFSDPVAVDFLVDVIRTQLPRLVRTSCVVSTLFETNGVLSVLVNTTRNPIIANYVLDTLVPILVNMVPVEFQPIFDILGEDSMSFIYWSIVNALPQLIATNDFAMMMAFVLYDTIVHLAANEELIEFAIELVIENMASLLEIETSSDPNQAIDLVFVIISHLVPMLVANDELVDITINVLVFNIPGVLAVPELRTFLFNLIETELQNAVDGLHLQSLVRNALETGNATVDAILWDLTIERFDFDAILENIISNVVTFENFDAILTLLTTELENLTSDLTNVTIDNLLEQLVARLTSPELITDGVDFVADSINEAIDFIATTLATFIRNGGLQGLYGYVIGGVAHFLDIGAIKHDITGIITDYAPDFVETLVQNLDLSVLITGLVETIQIQDQDIANIIDIALDIINLEEFANVLVVDLVEYLVDLLGDYATVLTFVEFIIADLCQIANLDGLNNITNALVRSIINGFDEIEVINNILEITFNHLVIEIKDIVSSERLGYLIDAVITTFIGDIGEIMSGVIDFLQIITLGISGDNFRIGGINQLLGSLLAGSVSPAMLDAINVALNPILNRVVYRLDSDGSIGLYFHNQGNYTPLLDMILSIPILHTVIGTFTDININDFLASGLFGARIHYDTLNGEITFIAGLSVADLFELVPVLDLVGISIPSAVPNFVLNLNMDIALTFAA
ncbi:MAG: hypothetical protein FWE01_00805 [Firmicutes bacterium]|nr:hypothetical protein [Bacillota bacterium]